MPSKEQYCLRILNAYSLIVDFKGIPPRENVPSPIEKETFKQWKSRVLGEGVSDVRIFQPTDPKPQTQIDTLRSTASASHMERLFRSLRREKDNLVRSKDSEHRRDKETAVEEAVARTEKDLKCFPKQLLTDLLDTKTLEPSVNEFFSRFTASTEEDIDIDSLLSDLIDVYNEAVKHFRSHG